MNSVPTLPTLRETLAICLNYKWSVMLAVLLPLIGATLYAVLATPVYEATSKVLVKSGREYLPQAEVADRNVSAPSTTLLEAIYTEVEILTSKDLAQQVVAAETLERLYPGMLAPHAGLSATIRSWFGAPPAPGGSPAPAAAEALQRDILVAPVKLSNVLQIGVRNQNSAVAVETLRHLLSSYQGRHVEAFAHQRGAVVETELAANRAELARVELERAEYRNAHALFSAPEQRTELIAQRARTARELEDTEVRQAALRRQIDYLHGQLAALPPTVTAGVVAQDSAAADESNKRLRELKAHEQQMLALFTEHSTMLNATRAAMAAHAGFLGAGRNRSNSVQTAINPLIATVKGELISAGAELTPLAGKVEQLAALIAEDDDKLRTLSTDEITLLGLDRRIAELGSADAVLRQRLGDAQLVDALDGARISSISVIEEPHALPFPVSPRKLLFVAGGMIAGLLLGGITVLLHLTFGTRLITEDTIERVLGVGVLTSLPLVRRRDRPAA